VWAMEVGKEQGIKLRVKEREKEKKKESINRDRKS